MRANSGLIFAVTHNYTGYPLVRQARAMVQAGDLGAIRVVQVEYAQDWLATRTEETAATSRPSGARIRRVRAPPDAVGDIGTHAFNLAEFITSDEVADLSADLHTFVEGRRLDDNAHMMLRFSSGAKGMLWCSQVAPGSENGLRIRVYGEKAGLEWYQENPNILTFSPLGEPPRLIRRNGPAPERRRAPLRAFRQDIRKAISRDSPNSTPISAEQIAARIENREPDPSRPAGADRRTRRPRRALHRRRRSIV